MMTDQGATVQSQDVFIVNKFRANVINQKVQLNGDADEAGRSSTRTEFVDRINDW